MRRIRCHGRLGGFRDKELHLCAECFWSLCLSEQNTFLTCQVFEMYLTHKAMATKFWRKVPGTYCGVAEDEAVDVAEAFGAEVEMVPSAEAGTDSVPGANSTGSS